MVFVEEFPPYLLPSFGGIPLNGGRVQSITVNPKNNDHIVVANELGGLWKTINGGKNWFHLDNLTAVFAIDVMYGADGERVIATLARDNSSENGGGIWISPDGGDNWSKPISADPPKHKRTPSRNSAYSISFAPDNPNKVYVGTDYGIAISKDKGVNWTHEMLETSSKILDNKKQNSVISILASKKNKVICQCRTGIYFKKDSGPWEKIESYYVEDTRGTYFFENSFKTIDVSPVDDNQIFILGPSRLYIYDTSSYKLNRISPPYAMSSVDRPGQFIRISKSPVTENTIDIWIGAGVNLVKSTWTGDVKSIDLDVPKSIILKRSAGIHENCGYIGLDNNKQPILYGSSGGLFKPTNKEATRWEVATKEGSGLNSYAITDVTGTHFLRSDGKRLTSLYFSTEDNGIWASADGGYSWPFNSSDEGFSKTYNECRSGFFLQAPQDAALGEDVTIAYAKAQCGEYPYMFSKANLMDARPIPAVDKKGSPISDMTEAFLISPRNWIRFRQPVHGPREIYVSDNNGLNWIKKADIPFEPRGRFTISSSTTGDLVIYVPIKGLKNHVSGGEIIGLLKLTDIFKPKMRVGSIFLPDNGSLGQRSTKFKSQAIYGVDPKNPEFIIAPDIYNKVIKISPDGGGRWIPNKNLNDQITEYDRLLLYEGDSYHMQVTQISFHPYDNRCILIGTRDSGIIMSKNKGDTWTTVASSNRISYVTGFFFNHDDTVIVSSYGRGLWKLDLTPSFPFETYCEGDCVIRFVFKPEIVQESKINWIDKDVIVFASGKINGLVVTKEKKIEKIIVSPGTVFRIYGNNPQNYSKLQIVESEKRQGFRGLKGFHAALKNNEIIKSIIIKENKIYGFISGKQEFENLR